MIRDVMRSQGYGEEEIQRVIDSDPFRLDYNLNYNPAYQSASTWNSYMGRMYPSYEKIDPETGKNVDELTAEELENYAKKTYSENITDGLEGQAATAAKDYLSKVSKPELTSPLRN